MGPTRPGVGRGVWLLRFAALLILGALLALVLAIAARASPDLPARLGFWRRGFQPWLPAGRALLLADLTLLVAVPLGTLAASGFWRSPPSVWRAAFGAAVIAVAASPLLAHGLAIRHLPGALGAGADAVVPAIAACLVVFLVVGAARDRVDPSMLRAAAAAGAGAWGIVRWVVGPAMARPIGVAAWAAFATSLVQTAFARAFAAPGRHDVAGLVLTGLGFDLVPHTVLLLAALGTLALLVPAAVAAAAGD